MTIFMKSILLNYKKNVSDVCVSREYQYNSELGLNVVDVNGMIIPFIDTDSECLALMTKTEAYRENDDRG